jgi:adenine phosphoribosyltransferase
LLSDGEQFHELIETLAQAINPLEIDAIAGIESRGFLIASALAYKLHLGLLLIRKSGKLPQTVISETYESEYGCATLEIQPINVKVNQRILLIDDVIATSNTINAGIKLLEKCQAKVVSVMCLI